MTSSLALQAMLVISMLSIGTMLAIIVLVQARRIRRLKLHLLNAEATSDRFCDLIRHE